MTGRRWASIRRQVLRDEPECRLQLEGCTKLATQVDHIIALSAGGPATDRANLQPLCHNCHVQKTRWDQGQDPYPY